jgi:hypothetical protein
MQSHWLAAALALAGAGCLSSTGQTTGSAGTGGVAGTSGGAGTAGASGTGGTTGVAGGAGDTTGAAGMSPDGGAGTGASDGGGTDADDTMPTLLSQTGLFSDVKAQTLASGVHPYAPTYTLWSDGATKRRWVYMPPGGKIDTSDMNYWQYPKGFKLWKEFTRDGVLVETRLLQKLGEGASDWFMVAFKWKTDHSDAVATPDGEQNVLGTTHDIPTKEQCGSCHNAMHDNALGFSALQLSHAIASTDPPGSVNLAMITQMGWLTNTPTTMFKLPGTAVEQQALGYLHANCGMCHNNQGHVYLTAAALDLWTHVDDPNASVQTTRAYLSMLCDTWPAGMDGTHSKYEPITACESGHFTGASTETTAAGVLGKRVTPGMPAMSAIHQLMSQRGAMFSMTQMPPLGTEDVDTTGLGAVDVWISALPAH